MTQFLFKRSGTADKRPDPLQMALGEVDLNYEDVTGGLFYKDGGGNVIKVGPAQVSATAPNATPAGSSGNSVGEFWYDTGASALKIWDGSAWQTTGGGGGIDPTILTAKGSIIAASAASTPAEVTVGTDGQILYADSGATEGVSWGQGPITALDFDATGDLLVGTGADTFTALPVGGDNTYLVADSTCTEGVKWAAIPLATPSTAGVNFGTYAVGSAGYVDAWDWFGVGSGVLANAVCSGLNFSGVTALGNGAAAGTGSYRASVVIGTCAGRVSGENSVIIGNFAACGAGANIGVLIGSCVGRAGAGTCNVVIGYATGNCTGMGSNNTFIGVMGPYNGFARASASDSRNIAIGERAMCRMAQVAACNTDDNIAVGNCALMCVSGGQNIAIGVTTGCEITEGCSNILIGHNMQAPSATGSCQLAIGNGANRWLTGDSTFAIKPGAGIIDCADSTGTAGQVLMSDGANAICWGTASGGSGIPCATITGKGALITGTAPSTPTALGVGTDGQILVADSACTTGLKWAPNTSGTVSAATPTVQGIVYGKQDCGTAYPDTGWDYSAYGINAGTIFNQFNNAQGAVALGNFSMECGVSCFQISAGYCSSHSAVYESCGVAIGYQAGAISCGFRTGGALEGQNVYVGSQSGCDACGGGNTFVGSQAGKFVVGECNTHIGYLSGPYFGALCSGAIVCENVSVGVRALAGIGTVASTTSTGNIGIGDEAGLTLQTGGYNIAIGWGAGIGSGSSVNNDNISIGRRAGLSISSGSNNILFGCCAGTATGGVSGAITTESNRIVMGNSAHTCAQIQVAWTTTSDVRDKALDPAGVPYGLLFVEKLEPIAYRWCDRCTNEVTDEKLRYGFSAQNIRSLEGDEPVIVSDDNEEKLMITDQHLLPVLVNAIKELSEKNRLLEERIAALEDKA